ncbi:MAG: hypothetical protein ACFCVF_04405 [Kineosporiaceae bacterium]
MRTDWWLALAAAIVIAPLLMLPLAFGPLLWGTTRPLLLGVVLATGADGRLRPDGPSRAGRTTGTRVRVRRS